jgi:hypothetical protein
MITYTVYRVTEIPAHEYDGAEIGSYEALVDCGEAKGYSPRKALDHWFSELPLEQQAVISSDARYMIVPVGNQHFFSPRIEQQTRLVY